MTRRRKRALIVHLDALPSVTPLVGGYLKAFALADPAVRDDWDIELYSAYVQDPASATLHAVVKRRPEVVAFSVYTWNVRLVSRLIETLRGLLPKETQFVVGGVEVIDSAGTFLDPSWSNVAVCNGEGEPTFRALLLELGAEKPNLEKVFGLSFLRDHEIVTTPGFPRIKDLSDIPSPWLSDMFTAADMAEVALFETNRGCPFACEFCYWGGAIGQKVNKVDVDRVREEITYIASRRSKALAICDANFGMLARDVGLAEHIVASKEHYKYPNRVLYSTAKNNTDRVVEIARIFTRGRLLHNQAISLQTMSDRALELAKRSNIKTDTYLLLQRQLNEWGVPSFVELIWPLPGETLESFRDGIDRLCRMGAKAITVYPLLWLRNVGYEGKAEAYGVTTLLEDDAAGGARIALQTNEVSFAEFLEGLVFSTGLYLLFDCRGLYLTSWLASSLGVARFRDIVDDFVAWMDERDGDDPISNIFRLGRERFEDVVKYTFRGAVADAALHHARAAFDGLLKAFVAEQGSRFSGEHAALFAAAFEFDLVSRPYVFVQTPLEMHAGLTHLRVTAGPQRRTLDVESPFDFPKLLAKLRRGETLTAEDLTPGIHRFRVQHRRQQVYRLPTKTDTEHQWHCHQIVRGIGEIEARYEVLQGETV